MQGHHNRWNQQKQGGTLHINCNVPPYQIDFIDIYTMWNRWADILSAMKAKIL